MDLDFHSSNLKDTIITVCAKGLRLKMLSRCDKNTDKQAALYVVMTRCSERLYLGYTSTLSSLFPEKNNAVYKYNVEIEIILLINYI